MDPKKWSKEKILKKFTENILTVSLYKKTKNIVSNGVLSFVSQKTTKTISVHLEDNVKICEY